MNETSWLYYTPIGEVVPVQPREGETVDRLYKRLRRLAKNYQPWERFFRVRRVGDVVLWQRVPGGEHTRLGAWHNLKKGDELRIATIDAELETKRAKATARYLKSAGKGSFSVELQDGYLRVARLS